MTQYWRTRSSLRSSWMGRLTWHGKFLTSEEISTACVILRAELAYPRQVSSPVRLEVRGEGPAVLFLHGTPTAWDALRPVAEACAGYTTLLAALPGYGGAPAWAGPVSAVEIAEAIESAVLASGYRRVNVVGFSGGANHALRIATRGVLEVDAVVALGGVGDLSAEERTGMRQFAASLRQAPLPPGLATARFLSPGFAAGHPDAVQRVEAWSNATSPENLAMELEAFADASPVLPALAGFAGRVLARTGTLDVAAPPAHAAAIARACPHGWLQLVEGAAHALLEEDRTGTVAATFAMLSGGANA